VLILASVHTATHDRYSRGNHLLTYLLTQEQQKTKPLLRNLGKPPTRLGEYYAFASQSTSRFRLPWGSNRWPSVHGNSYGVLSQSVVPNWANLPFAEKCWIVL